MTRVRWQPEHSFVSCLMSSDESSEDASSIQSVTATQRGESSDVCVFRVDDSARPCCYFMLRMEDHLTLSATGEVELKIYGERSGVLEKHSLHTGFQIRDLCHIKASSTVRSVLVATER